MKTALITVSPLDTSTGNRVTLNLADGPSAESFGIGGISWQPAIKKRPGGTLDLFTPALDGAVQAGKIDFTLAFSGIRSVRDPQNLYWLGAPVTFQSTDDYDLSTAKLEFVGNLTTSTSDLDALTLDCEATVSTTFIEQPLLTASFTGSGGAGGDPSFRGALYPAGFGAVDNIQPIWFDNNLNIGMIDGYGNTLSISWLAEGLSSFGPSQGDYASYAALAAAITAKTVAPGQWATCTAQGLVGLGAPPAGIITVNAIFGGNRPGAMQQMWLARAGVPVPNIDQASFNALDAICPYPVHYWTADQVQVSDLMQQMCASVNASPIVTFQGIVTVSRAVIKANPDGTLNRSGSVDPRVLDWKSVDTDIPYYLIKARAARPASVLTIDQVNYTVAITDRGTYLSTTVYSNGDEAWGTDGSSYLYINSAATAGEPLTNTDYWQPLQGATQVDYSNVVGSTRPQNNATVGAPLGTIVGDRSADEVVAAIDINVQSFLSLSLRQDQQLQLFNAMSYVNGQGVNGYVLNFQNEQIGVNQALESTVSLIGTKSSDGTSFVLNAATSISGNGQTLAEQLSDLEVKSGTVSSKVATLEEAFLNTDGTAKSFYTLEVSAIGSNGQKAVTGFSATADSDGSTSFAILATDFQIVDPSSGNPQTVFDLSGGIAKMHGIQIDTIKIGTSGVSISPVGFQTASSFSGSGSAPSSNMQVTGSYTLMIQAQVSLIIMMSGSLNYSASADYGADVLVTGPNFNNSYAASSSGAGFATPSFSGIGIVTLAPGTYTFSQRWRGSSGISLYAQETVILPVYTG